MLCEGTYGLHTGLWVLEYSQRNGHLTRAGAEEVELATYAGNQIN